MSAQKQQLLSDLKHRDQAPIGISLLSANRTNKSIASPINVQSTPSQQIRRIVPVIQFYTSTPPPLVPQLIKQFPLDSDRSGGQQLYRTPLKNNSSSKNQLREDSAQKTVTFSQQQGVSSITLDQPSFVYSNQQNLSSRKNVDFQSSPQGQQISRGGSPPSKSAQVRLASQDNNILSSYQQTTDNPLLTSLNGLTSARQSHQTFLKAQPVLNSVQINNFSGVGKRQVVSAFNTPIRKREDHLSYDQVIEKINGGGQMQEIPPLDNERYKVFTDEFLEQREKDLKRRIENLEQQRDLLDDQLKYKEDQLDKVVKDHSMCTQRIQQLEHTLESVIREKQEGEQQLNSDVERLNLIIKSLFEQNNKLQQQLSSSQRNQVQQS